MAGFSGIGRVFKYRNARIFYSGSAVAWTGLWMQRVATDWLAWQLTHSPLWVGIIAFCSLGPSMIVSPLAGAVADRLAQAEGKWAPFDRSGWRSMVYPDPTR